MTSIQLDLATVLSLLGLATGLIAIINFASQRKRTAVEAGKKEEVIEQLRRDLDRAHQKIRTMETCMQQSNLDTSRMAADMEWVKAALARIEARLARAEDDGK